MSGASSSTEAWTDTAKSLTPSLIFFPNDFPSDAGDAFRSLQRHSKDTRCRLLATLLAMCNRAIADEVTLLPKTWQRHVPPVTDFLALYHDAEFRKGPLGGAMEGVYLCILHLGCITAYHEIANVPYEFAKTGTTLAAIGCGLLGATAVAVSPTLDHLATVATPQVVRVAFRLGIQVYEVSSLLEAPVVKGDAESWAYVIPGVQADTVQAEIDTYNKMTMNPELTTIFISASDSASVSVSGPPSRLAAFLKGSAVLRFSNFFSLPVHHGLCHAPHIYSAHDVEAILGPTRVAGEHGPPLLNTLLSSETGRSFSSTTFDGLLAEVVDQLLTQRIHTDSLADGIVAHLAPKAVDGYVVWSFRSSLVLKGICAKLEACPDAPLPVRRDLVDGLAQEPSQRIPLTPKQAKLAVVGMSCRLPGGANDLELYWKLLAEGRDVHTTVPPDRFDLGAHYDPTEQRENTTNTPYMNFMDRPGFFDAGFFNMSPREALETDPMHRLALVTAYEALEMAGCVPNRTRSTSSARVGSYYGQASDDWRELNGSQNIGTYAVPGGERAFANGRIHYFFKFSGPCFNMDTACSSGLAAVNAACSALWAGEVDTALAGGLNVITDPDNFCQLGKGHFLSKTGQCKVWDISADGYCRADGVGSVVLKRLEDAEADNDNILGVILAAATNHSAEAASITQPHAPTQMLNYRNVMSRAGVNPLDVSYVELHGTGTQVGDREESRSVSDVFAPLAPQKRRKSQKLLVGSAKGNIGHGEAAAGVASFIKVLLMYQKGLVPPHVGMKVMNPSIPQDLAERNLHLCLELTPWAKPARGPRFAVVNSFGAHGGNTTVLLEDAPERELVGTDPRAHYPVTLSARSRPSMKKNIEALLGYLDEHPDVRLGDLSYTLCARRMHHPFRITTSVSSIDAVRRFLLAEKEKVETSLESIPLKSPPVAFVFTGQGAFYNGIGQQLYAHYPQFTSAVERLDRLVQSLGFPSILPCIDGSLEGEASPLMSQMAIVALEIALVQFWKSLGIVPMTVLGHSLGEYAALVAAGTLSQADALFLVGSRAKLLMESCEQGTHGMLAVRAHLATIEEKLTTAEHLKDVPYEVSCINTEQDTVLSGIKEDLAKIETGLKEGGLKCTMVNVPFAFHSDQVEPVLAPLEKLAENVKFKTPAIPVISPLLAECIFDGKTINASYLRRATREPVDFVGALDAAQELGTIGEDTVWIEIGPHFLAGNLVKDVVGSKRVVASLQRSVDNFATISSSLASLHEMGVGIVWNEYFRPYEKAHRLLTLKSYQWNDKDYWIPYIGNWTLDKANIKHNLEKLTGRSADVTLSSKLKTSLIHGIVSETIEASKAFITTQSNLLDPSFLEAVDGHNMNGHGVATQSIWADMAFTVGRYLHRQLKSMPKDLEMNIRDVVILEGQVADRKRERQIIQLEAVLDATTRTMPIQLYNVSDDGVRAAEAFGSLAVAFEDPEAWRREWARLEHLVAGQIESLEARAAAGRANRLTKGMAYTLFKNVVDYAERYRGMDTVVVDGYEACADVTLAAEAGGVWHTPPHWIDSVAHLAGFVMNGSDASDTAGSFFVTPGWESMRFLRPLAAGARYRSYVKMLPTADKGTRAGDVYILQDGAIVGMVGQIKFRQFPRLLMSRFFSPDKGGHVPAPSQPEVVPAPAPAAQVPAAPAPAAVPVSIPAPAPAPGPPATAHVPMPQAASTSEDDSGLRGKIFAMIAAETGLDRSDLHPNTQFANVGVDSLMSLVLAEKFKANLGIDIKSSLFLECPSIDEFCGWLEENR
ncbi:type I iterative polyketide synthase [Apiospora arundinis]|uniref:Type I iterative polyketide synthase n=1 Tax=Apiospora arundinis TaxID=335852 RepID=A0ABR2IQS0_9PEZI